jgi:hypothetical protein
MSRTDVASSTIEELVEAYRRAAAAHGQATSDGDHRAANRHHDVIAKIYRELRSRGPSAQSALVPLIHDANDGVRSWAAAHALEFAPERAEPVLEKLAAGSGLVGFAAEMTLEMWRKGELKFP